ncbi:MAG TPA: alpha-ribazole phosphatase [Bacillota bacterium]|jgi:probable phosphoglycerate mutase|nr:alpha-ribazole phosphatase [Peptococcaceae bacterium MAG4]HPZ43715.1 alpha-ribazole phosphatase [Bacillota bacterium]HUM58537.1 alpha-ribazole phosphatase [Bacillota bacterium]
MVQEIYLLRHGEIDTGGKKRFIGHTDLPLSDSGRAQAARLRDELSCVPFSSVFCSDLTRSVMTANIICEKQGLKPVIMKNLREINMGSWDGLSFEEVRRLYPGEFEKRGADIVNYQPPGGESFAQCSARVLSALDEILASAHGIILIVGHKSVNRIILSWAMGTPLERMFEIPQEYGCLNKLVCTSGLWRVV